MCMDVGLYTEAWETNLRQCINKIMFLDLGIHQLPIAPRKGWDLESIYIISRNLAWFEPM